MEAELDPLVLTVAELRSSTAKLLDVIEARFGSAIDLGADHYWLIEADAAFDRSKQPDVNAGQLADDLASVRAMGSPGPTDLWHDLDHLLGLLRRISAIAR